MQLRPKQISLFKPTRHNTKKSWIEKQSVYGGSLDYRKCKRPFSSKKLTHVVFKAKLGKSIWFTRSQKSIAELLKYSCARYNLKLKAFSIQKDHVHVLCFPLQTNSRLAQENFKNFLRFFACEMGRKYKQIFIRFGLNKNENLWVKRPFTRLISWGKGSLEKILNYIEKNELEALGFVDYTPRKHQLNRFLQHWAYDGFKVLSSA